MTFDLPSAPKIKNRAGGIFHYSITGYDVIKLYHNEDVTQPQTHVNVYTTILSTVYTHKVQYTHIVYFLDFLLGIVGLPAHSEHCGKNFWRCFIYLNITRAVDTDVCVVGSVVESFNRITASQLSDRDHGQ